MIISLRKKKTKKNNTFSIKSNLFIIRRENTTHYNTSGIAEQKLVKILFAFSFSFLFFFQFPTFQSNPSFKSKSPTDLFYFSIVFF